MSAPFGSGYWNTGYWADRYWARGYWREGDGGANPFGALSRGSWGAEVEVAPIPEPMSGAAEIGLASFRTGNDPAVSFGEVLGGGLFSSETDSLYVDDYTGNVLDGDLSTGDVEWETEP